MIIYVEDVLINNFIIDYLTLKATFALTGTPLSKGRLFLCAFFGSILALIFPLIESEKVLSSIIRVVSGCLITLIAYKGKSLRKYFLNTAVFFTYTFLLIGVILGISSLLNLNVENSIIISFIALPVYFLLKIFGAVITYLYRQKSVRVLTYRVELSLMNKKVNCTGFLDTGNGLYYKDNPVIVCNKDFALSLMGENVGKIKLNKMPFSTVNGNGENLCFNLDLIKIYLTDKPNIFNNVTIMVSKNAIGDGYDLILHPDLIIKENLDEKDASIIKKVC